MVGHACAFGPRAQRRIFIPLVYFYRVFPQARALIGTAPRSSSWVKKKKWMRLFRAEIREFWGATRIHQLRWRIQRREYFLPNERMNWKQLYAIAGVIKGFTSVYGDGVNVLVVTGTGYEVHILKSDFFPDLAIYAVPRDRRGSL